MSEKNYSDQAEQLRKLTGNTIQHLKIEEQQTDFIGGLPPRSEYHKKKKKRIYIKIKFPLVHFLVVLFFIIIILAVTSPIWIEKFF